MMNIVAFDVVEGWSITVTMTTAAAGIPMLERGGIQIKVSC